MHYVLALWCACLMLALSHKFCFVVTVKYFKALFYDILAHIYLLSIIYYLLFIYYSLCLFELVEFINFSFIFWIIILWWCRIILHFTHCAFVHLSYHLLHYYIFHMMNYRIIVFLLYSNSLIRIDLKSWLF